jgi:biotin carboxyl carrier protein
VRVEGEGDSWRVIRGRETTVVSAAWLPDGRLSLLFPDGRQACGRLMPAGAGEIEVVTAAGSKRVHLADPLSDRLSHAGGQGGGSEEQEIRSLMPGRVLEVRVAQGDRVEAGQVLIVLEAMKMQNEIRASTEGTVARCAVSAGDAVEGRALLLVVLSSPNP